MIKLACFLTRPHSLHLCTACISSDAKAAPSDLPKTQKGLRAVSLTTCFIPLSDPLPAGRGGLLCTFVHFILHSTATPITPHIHKQENFQGSFLLQQRHSSPATSNAPPTVCPLPTPPFQASNIRPVGCKMCSRVNLHLKLRINKGILKEGLSNYD